ncbi:MAG TPA: phosphoglucosamine mutase [Porphyromonadaceae bacterium]|jgi:phosphomannomutase|nr:phosphoglucosamine mutase [Proteiniphilum sp. UBA5218]HAC72495.1 phosphoglucosamine mutase [Porphyromonadaceae bacterium]HBC37441.1 phosphoglucosamine mutase [Porphyromonadaceae bacterium]HBK41911.1 phosphoglucosamine mutase [Porphyromonadaceae bacterium]HCA99863.1 phosphoglucosamine mutase [Porphyromonadaceae bacterium]HCB88003.1 phosphoglucosamine mutase [Porphyromonadaceae bacterium]
MTLIKSISGIRGTIGGRVGDNLTPVDIVKFASAYALFIKKITGDAKPKIVVGRDARISGNMVHNLITGTLMGMGCDVVDVGMATTPTTEIAVVKESASGGIIITASHNPKQWNALKLLNSRGEFLNADQGKEILEMAEAESFEYASVDELGKVSHKQYLHAHIQSILQLDLVDLDAIKAARFRVAVDAVNSVGGNAVPELLYALGVKEVFKLHCAIHGNFSHNPEPLPQNLTELSSLMKSSRADVGFAVDPDVDRLVIYAENGEPFGEEYTLVAVSDYILQHTPGNTVSNLSSTRALRDITQRRGGDYFAAAVGEVNVVAKMKEVGAVIGGEGNGGVIYPASHYGRDALVGIALFLTQLAKSGKKVSELRAEYPGYFMSKQKIELTPDIDTDAILQKVKERFNGEQVTDIDGVKIDFPDKWVHLRKSNTEPIIRIYSEAKTQEEAEEVGKQIIDIIKELK